MAEPTPEPAKAEADNIPIKITNPYNPEDCFCFDCVLHFLNILPETPRRVIARILNQNEIKFRKVRIYNCTCKECGGDYKTPFPRDKYCDKCFKFDDQPAKKAGESEETTEEVMEK